MNNETTEIENLRRLTEAVCKSGVDIAPTYAEYVQLAFAIATDLGEAGRDCFIRLCAVSPKYNADHAQRQYSNALRSSNGSIHLGTVYHLAERAGVKMEYDDAAGSEQKNAVDAENAGSPSRARPCARTYNNGKSNISQTGSGRKAVSDFLDEDIDAPEEMLRGSSPTQPLPVFPPSQWPEFLQNVIDYGRTDAQRDILLLGAVTALGSTMERYVRCLYGGLYMSPCLQTFVVANPACGKGVLALVRMLVEPIHNEMRSRMEQEMRDYEKAKIIFNNLGKKRASSEPPIRPRNRMFLISGNNTGTGILQNIMDNDGTGIICETEADTITTAIGTEYGHWSDTLRKTFDHDRLAFNRRTDDEYREVKRTYLSVLLSGTPAQVKPLIPSAENGLFSRQLFYYMPDIHEWKSQFDNAGGDLNAVFLSMGEKWKQTIEDIRRRGVHTLCLSDSQKEAFDKAFSKLFERACVGSGSEMTSSVARMGINLCRIMSVVAILRAVENPALVKPSKTTLPENVEDGAVSQWDVEMTDADFYAVLAIMEPIYRHTIHILSFLPSTEIKRRGNADCDMLFGSMSEKFSRAELLECAQKMGIKPNTACSWLQRLQQRGIVRKVDEYGYYTLVRS